MRIKAVIDLIGSNMSALQKEQAAAPAPKNAPAELPNRCLIFAVTISKHANAGEQKVSGARAPDLASGLVQVRGWKRLLR